MDPVALTELIPSSTEPSEASAGHVALGAPSVTLEMPRARLLNRELSWLDFNSRVMEEAEAGHNPLLERVGFLAISANNLDEFFMKRVGGLQRQLAAGVTRLSPDGRTPLEQLEAIRARVLGMIDRQSELWFRTVLPQLHEAKIHL